MRLAAYAGTSALVAAGALLKAFHQRPNFYSATVYLSQSNACVLVGVLRLLLPPWFTSDYMSDIGQPGPRRRLLLLLRSAASLLRPTAPGRD